MNYKVHAELVFLTALPYLYICGIQYSAVQCWAVQCSAVLGSAGHRSLRIAVKHLGGLQSMTSFAPVPSLALSRRRLSSTAPPSLSPIAPASLLLHCSLIYSALSSGLRAPSFLRPPCPVTPTVLKYCSATWGRTVSAGEDPGNKTGAKYGARNKEQIKVKNRAIARETDVEGWF